MSYAYPVTPDHPLCGVWSAPTLDEASDSVRTQFTISVVEERFRVTGVDPLDGEEFIIYDIGYDGEYLRFVSHMPSTHRTARNWMRVIDRDKVECKWTITETDIWVRKPLPFQVVK